MKMKKKNRSNRYDINKPSPGHGYKYSKLSNTEAELKKSIAY